MKHGNLVRSGVRAATLRVHGGKGPQAHCIICAGHSYIGTEHILLGLLREGEGIAARVLETMGAEPSKIRNQVRLQAACDSSHNLRLATCRHCLVVARCNCLVSSLPACAMLCIKVRMPR